MSQLDYGKYFLSNGYKWGHGIPRIKSQILLARATSIVAISNSAMLKKDQQSDFEGTKQKNQSLNLSI